MGLATGGRVGDAIREAIREAILEGTLPAGTWLNEEFLASVLQVSRTPIREAIRHLAGEGLTVRSAGNVATVAGLTVQDVIALYVVRESLEGIAAREVTLLGDAATVVTLREHNKALADQADSSEPKQLSELNHQFHKVLWSATNNYYLIRFLNEVHDGVRRIGRSSYEVSGAAQESIEEHERIIEAVARGDADGAERATRDHARRGRERRMRLLPQMAIDFKQR